MGAAASQHTGLLLGLVASVGRLLLSLPRDWNLHFQLWVRHFPPVGTGLRSCSCPRAALSCLVAVPVVRRHRELAGCVQLLSGLATLHSSGSSRLVCPGSLWSRPEQTPLQDVSFATSARWLWLPLRVPVLQGLLTDLWPSLLAPPALPAVGIPCLPEGILQCRMRDSG